MADDTPPPGPTHERKRTWHERELAQALERLAIARERLAVLEEQAEAPAPFAQADPADLAKADELHAEIVARTPKASARFGGAKERARIEELQVALHLVLDRTGVASYEALVATRDQPSAPALDPDVVAFATREFADAQRSFLEVAAMEMPPADPDPEVDDEADGPDAEVLHFKADPAAS